MTVTVKHYAPPTQISALNAALGDFFVQGLQGDYTVENGTLHPSLKTVVLTTYPDKFYPPGNTINDVVRCQIGMWNADIGVAAGVEKWYGFVYAPDPAFDGGKSWQAVATFHAGGTEPLPFGIGIWGPGMGGVYAKEGPAYMLDGYGGQQQADHSYPNHYNQILAPYSPKPVRFYVHIRWSTGPDGIVEVFMDGKQVGTSVLPAPNLSPTVKGPTLMKRLDGSVAMPYLLFENYHPNLNPHVAQTTRYSELVIADSHAELDAFFTAQPAPPVPPPPPPPPAPTPAPPSPALGHAQKALADLRGSDAYRELQHWSNWQTTKLYACEQELLATIKSLS